MRFLIRVEIPVEAGNAAIKNGKLPEVMKNFQDKWKPEAAYFTVLNGNRTGYFFAQLNDLSQIPSMVEPFFIALNAKVDWFPAMNGEDLAKGIGAAMDEVKKW